jgi:hypothetical protein
MKKSIFGVAICLMLSGFCMTSCSEDDPQTAVTNQDIPPGTNPQTHEPALFAIDTARINKVTVTGTANTIINHMQNTSSFIGDISISTDGAKFAYSNYQRTFNPDTFTTELRVANADGSNDRAIFSSSEPYVNINAIRFCSDNKIFFIVETSNPTVRKMYTINPDGTGQQLITGQYDMADISNDREYYLINSFANNNIQIIDKDGDNGAGSLYHNEPFTTDQTTKAGSFTNDGSKVVIPFKEGNDIKARIIDMATKTATTKTLVTGLGTGWLSFHLEMGGDSNRGVITLTGSDFAKSKSYLFNLDTGQVDAPFENSNENIFDVYIY